MKTTFLNIQSLVSCLAVIAAQAVLVSAYASDPADNPGQLAPADYKFAKEAAAGGLMEVNLGRIAADKSTNAAVQQFGQRMVTDHGKAGQDLQQVAIQKGATLPSQPTESQQKEIDRLQKLSEPDFDKAYLAFMVKDHKSDEKEFKKASEKAQDPDLKVFAANTLPIIEEHLKMAQDLDENVKHDVSMSP